MGFKGNAIIAPSDLCSLEGGHAVEENKYLTNFVIDSFLELPQAARTDGVEVVVFPYEQYRKQLSYSFSPEGKGAFYSKVSFLPRAILLEVTTGSLLRHSPRTI